MNYFFWFLAYYWACYTCWQTFRYTLSGPSSGSNWWKRILITSTQKMESASCFETSADKYNTLGNIPACYICLPTFWYTLSLPSCRSNWWKRSLITSTQRNLQGVSKRLPTSIIRCVISQRVIFVYRRFGTPCLFHLLGRIDEREVWSLRPRKWNRQGVSKRLPTSITCWVISQKPEETRKWPLSSASPNMQNKMAISLLFQIPPLYLDVSPSGYGYRAYLFPRLQTYCLVLF